MVADFLAFTMATYFAGDLLNLRALNLPSCNAFLDRPHRDSSTPFSLGWKPIEETQVDEFLRHEGLRGEAKTLHWTAPKIQRFCLKYEVALIVFFVGLVPTRYTGEYGQSIN